MIIRGSLSDTALVPAKKHTHAHCSILTLWCVLVYDVIVVGVSVVDLNIIVVCKQQTHTRRQHTHCLGEPPPKHDAAAAADWMSVCQCVRQRVRGTYVWWVISWLLRYLLPLSACKCVSEVVSVCFVCLLCFFSVCLTFSSAAGPPLSFSTLTLS